MGDGAVQVVSQLASGKDAFAALTEAHLPALRRFAATLVALDDVDDCVQDALARAWRKREQQDDERGNVRSWLFSIVRDQARQRHRRRPAPWTLAELGKDVAGDVAAPARQGAVTVDVRRAVDALPERQRTAIVLFHYVDLPVGEVAELMGCSPGTVKSTLHDARRALARQLGASYGAD